LPEPGVIMQTMLIAAEPTNRQCSTDLVSMLVGILCSEKIDNTAAVRHERFELALSQSLVVQVTAGYCVSVIGFDRTCGFISIVI
jgi:hypothetical protein